MADPMLTFARCGWLLGALLLVRASMAFASETRDSVRQIDAARSHAEFSLRAMLVVGVQGKFGGVSGSVHLDSFRSQGWVDARIDANAVSMGSSDREIWARSEEFFDSANHPIIRFVSEPVPQLRLRTGGDLPGTLTLRGVERPVLFTILPGECLRPGEDCAIQAQGSIARSEFGMRSKRAVLGDRVRLDLSVLVKPVAVAP